MGQLCYQQAGASTVLQPSISMDRHGHISPVGLTLVLTALFSLSLPTVAVAEEESPTLWLVSAEAGAGPIDGDLFVNFTPRLTALRPVPLLWCENDEECETMLEVSLHLPLRLDVTGADDGIIRREDWLEPRDYFRLLRRLEYGSTQEPLHLRLGEIGPVQLGHGTVVNDYYNVVTTDHYRPGLTAQFDDDRWGAEVLINDLTGPNLFGIRGRWRPEQLYDEDSQWRRVALGASTTADVTAPWQLAEADDDTGDVVAGTGLLPVVDEARPTVVTGVDARWELPAGSGWSITPYTDLNHHFGLGTGVHLGLIWNQQLGEDIRLSSRLEYRLLTGRYIPDYFDHAYELTRYHHPDFTAPDDEPAAPRLRAASRISPQTRHGGLLRLQSRFFEWLTLSAAYADATGPTGASLRFRASYDHEDRGRFGVFYAKSAPGERSFGDTMTELFGVDGALTAVEARYTIWGPIYGHGQLAQLWRVTEQGEIDHVYLWNIGVGAGTRF